MPLHRTVLKPENFGAVLCCLKTGRSLTSRPIAASKNKRRSIRSDRSRSGSLYHTARKGRFHIRRPHLWHFSTVQSRYCRLSSWPLEPVLASGAQSTCWKVTAMITVRHVRELTPDYRRKACAQGRRNNDSENLGELIFRWMK